MGYQYKKQGMTGTEILIIISMVIMIASIFVQPYFEMRAFNKFSDKKATYMDALFSQLRIEANRVN